MYREAKNTSVCYDHRLRIRNEVEGHVQRVGEVHVQHRRSRNGGHVETSRRLAFIVQGPHEVGENGGVQHAQHRVGEQIPVERKSALTAGQGRARLRAAYAAQEEVVPRRVDLSRIEVEVHDAPALGHGKGVRGEAVRHGPRGFVHPVGGEGVGAGRVGVPLVGGGVEHRGDDHDVVIGHGVVPVLASFPARAGGPRVAPENRDVLVESVVQEGEGVEFSPRVLPVHGRLDLRDVNPEVSPVVDGHVVLDFHADGHLRAPQPPDMDVHVEVRYGPVLARREARVVGHLG